MDDLHGNAHGRRSGTPRFGPAFLADFESLVRWRRDVRRFRPDPVDEDLVRDLVRLATHAPSVGNSQPWRFVKVESETARDAVVRDFERCNAEALRSYRGERAALYARLKLEGLREAPVHLAVFCDESCVDGHGLGRGTMPETLPYSVVGAVQILWLAARAHGLGVGWVSILDPETLRTAIGVPAAWRPIAYLCVGYPVEEHLDPELVRAGWQDRLSLDSVMTVCR